MKKKTATSLSALTLGVILGVSFYSLGGNKLIGDYVDKNDNIEIKFFPPSYYSKAYEKEIPKEDMYSSNQGSFFLYAEKDISLKEDSKVIKDMKSLVETYTKEFLANYDYTKGAEKHIAVAKKFYIEKDAEFWKNQLEDMKSNEAIFRITTKDLHVSKYYFGAISADMDTINAGFDIEFTVDKKIKELIPDQISNFIEGKTYVQRRDVLFRKTNDGSWKLEQIEISQIKEK